MQNQDYEDRLCRLRKEKTAVIELSDLQKQLRAAVFARMSQRKITREKIAVHLNVHKQKILDFLNGQAIYVGEKLLDAMEEFLGDSEITDSIRNVIKPINNTPKMALAIFGADTINLVYDIHEVYSERIEIRRDVFAEAFGDQSQIILDVMRNRRAGYEALQNPGNAQAVLERLTTATLWQDVLVLHQKMIDEFTAKRNVLKPLMEELVAHYKTVSAVLSTLGYNKNRYAEIMQKEPNYRAISITSLEEMIEKCEQELAVIRAGCKKAKKTGAKKTKPVIDKQTSFFEAQDKDIPPADVNPHELPTCLNERQIKLLYYQLNGAIACFKGAVKIIEGFAQSDLAPIRDEDRLELARALLKLINLGIISFDTLNEIAYGQPFQDKKQLLDLVKMLNPKKGNG
jgi:hypothetical protein